MRVFCASSFSSRRSSAQRTGSSSQRGLQRFEQARAFDRGGEIPAAIDVDHQVVVVADDFAHQLQALHVFRERQRRRPWP